MKNRREVKRNLWRIDLFGWALRNSGLVLAALTLLLFAILALCTFFITTFFLTHGLTVEPSEPKDYFSIWGAFGDFFGAVIQAIIAILTIFAAVFLATFHQFKGQTVRESVKLSELMYDREFYIHIVAPSWEIATKWLNWEGEGGNAYRRSVLAGDVINIQPTMKFENKDRANARLFKNPLDFRDHYAMNPRDVAFSNLSEHMVLTIWIQFWNHVYYLKKHELAEDHTLADLLGPWYRNWHPFMCELRLVSELCAEDARKHAESKGPVEKMRFINPIHLGNKKVFNHLRDIEEAFGLKEPEGASQRAKEVFDDVKAHYLSSHNAVKVEGSQQPEA